MSAVLRRPTLAVLATGGVGIVLAAAFAPAALAAPAAAARPAASCKVPTVTVSPTSGRPGTRLLVTGRNFSGCPAQGSSARPSSQLTVVVGLAQKGSSTTVKQTVLGTTRTAPGGSFTLTVTLPAGSTAGRSAIDGASRDPATGLTYAAATPFVVTGPRSTSTGSSTGSSSGTTSSSSGTTSSNVPTRVNAGSGGLAADHNQAPTGELALLGIAGIGGLGLAGIGARRLARR